MRETAAQFPEDDREEVLMEIGNVEEQLNKPEEKRNRKLIAKKLGAILAIAASIGFSDRKHDRFYQQCHRFSSKGWCRTPDSIGTLNKKT
jgi:hypothetical protein